MKDQSTKDNSIRKTMRKNPKFQTTQSPARFYTREYKNFRFFRKVTIPLKDILVIRGSEQGKSLQKHAQQQKILLRQYDLQNEIKSEYVIKNFAKISEKKGIIWIQEDFNCFLSQLEIKNFTFKRRFQIFDSIARGVHDLSEKLVCHRFLCPSSISIQKVSEESLVGKINCFQTALTLQNSRSLTNEMAQKINQYSSPELAGGKVYGLASDIWSLGCLLNYLLYDTIQNIWQEEEETKIEVPDDTPQWLLELLKSMLHFNQSKRYSIKTIIDILRSSWKCIDVLGKYIPVGRDSLKLSKKGSNLSSQFQR